MALTFSRTHIKKKKKPIYMYNNSHRTSTECWQDLKLPLKGNKSSTQLGRTKAKEREKRNQDGTSTSERELARRKGTHTLGSHLTDGS